MTTNAGAFERNFTRTEQSGLLTAPYNDLKENLAEGTPIKIPRNPITQPFPGSESLWVHIDLAYKMAKAKAEAPGTQRTGVTGAKTQYSSL